MFVENHFSATCFLKGLSKWKLLVSKVGPVGGVGHNLQAVATKTVTDSVVSIQNLRDWLSCKTAISAPVWGCFIEEFAHCNGEVS